jgi:hypothetical protein
LDAAALPSDEIAERARLAGLSSSGGPVETLKRLAWAQDYSRRGSSSAGGGSTSAASAPVANIVDSLLDRPANPLHAPPAGIPSERGLTADRDCASQAPAAKPVRSKRKRHERDGGGDSTAWATVDVDAEEHERERQQRERGGAAESDSDEDLDGVPLEAPLAVGAAASASRGPSGSSWAQLAASAVLEASKLEGVDSDDEDVDGVPL